MHPSTRSATTAFHHCIGAALALAMILAGSSGALAGGNVTKCDEAGLRAALNGGGVVTFSCDTTITITNSIVISVNTTLDGTGRDVGISGGNSIRLFTVQPGVELIIRNVRLLNGQVKGANGAATAGGEDAVGACILNQAGTVRLVGCRLSGHTVAGGAGGAGGTALSGAGEDGGAGGRALGAAIYNSGRLFITNCVFSGATATAGAAGAGGPGVNRGNGNNGGHGGNAALAAGAAIYNEPAGAITVVASTFSTNRVIATAGGAGGTGVGILGFSGRNGLPGPARGGAICNVGGEVVILNSTFFGNQATGANGGNALAVTGSMDGLDGTGGSNAEGGGVYTSGAAAVTNSTFSANIVIGGNGGDGGNGGSSSFGGDGGDGGAGGSGLGAGFFSGSTTASVVNCTFADASARGGTGGTAGKAGTFVARDGQPGAAGVGAGAAVFNQTGTLRLKNSILADSINGSIVGGAITDEGFNLSSDASVPLIGGRTNLNPQLLPLADNGGPTQTIALPTNSPALNQIDVAGANGAPEVDQRGARREMPFDIGAFELFGSFTNAVVGVSAQTNWITVTWPSSLSNYVLQTRTTLPPQPTTNWITISNTPVANRNLNTLSFPFTNKTGFFRLLRK